MKKPCVVSNVIGNHDVIHNEENGFVCDSVDEFVEAVRNIQQDMCGQAYEGDSGTANEHLKVVVGGETRKLAERAYEDIMEKCNTGMFLR